jgi:hypothetical protein
MDQDPAHERSPPGVVLDEETIPARSRLRRRGVGPVRLAAHGPRLPERGLRSLDPRSEVASVGEGTEIRTIDTNFG